MYKRPLSEFSLEDAKQYQNERLGLNWSAHGQIWSTFIHSVYTLLLINSVSAIAEKQQEVTGRVPISGIKTAPLSAFIQPANLHMNILSTVTERRPQRAGLSTPSFEP